MIFGDQKGKFKRGYNQTIKQERGIFFGIRMAKKKPPQGGFFSTGLADGVLVRQSTSLDDSHICSSRAFLTFFNFK